MPRKLTLYVLVLSIIWALCFPDYRFGGISILLNQFIYPVLLGGTALVLKLDRVRKSGIFFLFAMGLLVNTLISIVVFSFLSDGNVLDDNYLSASIYFGALVAKAVVTTITFFLATFLVKLHQ